MTGTDVDIETQAQRIAARGREALVERMRTAYGDAAAAHADLISLDAERIETLVQSAVDHADGLQWRRALARVASDELGLSVPEALSHPAVARAQQLVGAPSYEQSLAEMIARPVPLPAPAALETAPAALESVPAAVDTAPALVQTTAPAAERQPEVAETEAPSDGLETVEADDVVLELLPEPDPLADETQAYDVEASFVEEQLPPAPTNPFAAAAAAPAATAAPAAEPAAEPAEADAPATAEHHVEPQQLAAADAAVSDDEPAAHATAPASEPEADAEAAATEVTIPAIHLGGVANLPTKREGLNVRLSADGLDIMQGPRDIIGRLVWDEIEALQVPNLRVRRRAKQLRARLIVRTPHGDASFEVPDISGDELRERVEPLMRLYGRQ